MKIIQTIRLVQVFCLQLATLGSWCQMTPVDVLSRIEDMQVSSDAFYDEGLFPVQRTWNLSNEPVEDNTIFFTAAILHTLNGLDSYLDFESTGTVEKIRQRALQNYPKYVSRNGEPTYNFWQTTGPDLPFPNGNRWVSNPKMRLPDDFHSSVMLAMTADNKQGKLLLREKMTAYAARANRSDNTLNTLAKYEDSRAYEVWFGKEMPQTFDICVMANTLMFVFSEGYQLNTYDLETIDLIKQMVMSDDYIEHTDDVSHHTTSSAVILYHVARLMEADTQGLLDEIKPKVLDDLVASINYSASEMEKMLAQTALIMLGGYPVGVIDHALLEQELSTYPFFIVKPFLGNPQLAFLNAVVPDIQWKCEAYNWTLYFEYLQVNQRYLSNNSGSH